MTEADYYPAGAYLDPNAPYNQHDPDPVEFDVICTQTLSKTVPVETSNYTEEVDEEYDEEGQIYRSASYDTSDVDWEDEFINDGYHTPLELLGLFKTYLEDILNGTKKANYSPSKIKALISECEDWQEEETTYEEE